MTDDIDRILLRKLVDEVTAIRERLGESAQQSSVEVSTSARGYDVRVKCYVGSPVRPAGDAAIEEYVRVHSELEEQLIDGFAKTAKAVKPRS